MPVFKLTNDLLFPPPHLADPDGLVAIGGDLTPERLLLAYSSGLFPWFNADQPPLWWCPDPRCIIEPGGMHISRTLRKTLRQQWFQVTCDRDFPAVIAACARVRMARGEETWITDQLIESFVALHEQGYAHSLECWLDGKLAGGVYGLGLGRCFFGESMFHTIRDASKVALAHLARMAAEEGYELIDCQLPNGHLASLGAREIPRIDFHSRLGRGGVSPSVAPVKSIFRLPVGGFGDW